jgi:hypothetical protein
MRPLLRGNAPLAVILCRFSDVGTPNVPRSRFFEMVTEYGPNGLFEYWKENSGDTISMAGSDVFGWYTMQYSFVNDSLDPLHNPSDPTPRREVWMGEARRLAAADGVDLSGYHGLIVVINASGDSSNAGTDMVMNVWGPWGQSSWRWCNKCDGLTYAGGAALGPCAAGGNHDHTGSGNYAVALNDTTYPGQPNWRWCNKCQGLAFAGGASLGPCPAGGNHDHTGSGEYRLGVKGSVGHDGQDQWKWCNKCQSLAYAGNSSPGPCPAGGNHDHTGSGDYVLASVDSNLDLTFTAHETGHGYGLEHSWSANPDTEYGDPWDIMSAMRVRAFQRGPYVNNGPLLNAPKRHKVGWLPDARVVTYRQSSSIILGGITVTLNALDRLDGDGPLMARVLTADKIYTVEYRRPVGWDSGIGGDAVLIHELRSHYTAGQNNWRWCSKCQALFWAGWAICPAGDVHDHNDSGVYILNNTGSGDGQVQWKWCNKCQQITYAGSASPGFCAAGGNHDHRGSGDYRIASSGGGQSGWKWCRKCQALTYGGSARPGACPAGGDHNHNSSGDYTVPSAAGSPGQGSWCWCRKCQGMSFVGLAPCAAGGAHQWWTGSGDYGLASSSLAVKNGQAAWRWCRKCQQLAYTGGTAIGACSGGGNHDHAGSGEYMLATDASGMNGQANWRWCRKCQTLAFGGAATPGACPATGQHDFTGSGNYVLGNPGNDLVYLVGADRHVNDVFDDPARNVHIVVLATDATAGTARIQLGRPASIHRPPGL